MGNSVTSFASVKNAKTNMKKVMKISHGLKSKEGPKGLLDAS